MLVIAPSISCHRDSLTKNLSDWRSAAYAKTNYYIGTINGGASFSSAFIACGEAAVVIPQGET